MEMYVLKISVHCRKEDVPSPINPAPGCRFAGRCRFCQEKCHLETPELKDIGNDHMVSCHFIGNFKS